MYQFLKKCIQSISYQFNQKALLKPYIDMTTKLRKEAKYYFEKDFFFKLMNNGGFGNLWKIQEKIEISSSSQKIKK